MVVYSLSARCVGRPGLGSDAVVAVVSMKPQAVQQLSSLIVLNAFSVKHAGHLPEAAKISTATIGAAMRSLPRSTTTSGRADTARARGRDELVTTLVW